MQSYKKCLTQQQAPQWKLFLSPLILLQFSSVQSLSHVRLLATPWIAARQASLSITNSRSSLRLTSIESVMPSSHLILCRPLLLLPTIPPQHQSLFQWVNSSHEMAKVLEFQLYHHSFQRNPRADLLQNGLVGSPCSPRDSRESSPTPQFKSINSSVLSFLPSPTLTSIHDHWKNHTLDYTDLCWKCNVSLLFNMLSRLVITFLPRSKRLLISWLQSPSAVILEPPKNKVWHCFYCLPIYLPWSDGTRYHDLKFSECWALSQLFHFPHSLSSRGLVVPLHFLP